MEKLGSFLYGAGGFIAGALLMVGGWWLSMLNISIDRYSGTDFTNLWTIFGLIMIFIGAYLPFMIVGLRARFVRKRRELRETVASYERDSQSHRPDGPTASPSDGPVDTP
ncbi:MAG: hypothetical protein U0R64_08155 [Candidatus Nanopelagicales bacterium]